MRRLIVILIVVAAGVTVLHAYERVGIATVNKEVAAAGVVGRELTVPVTPAFASPDSAATYLPVMEQAAERSRVDVLRTVIGYRAQHGKPFIEELVFLTGPTGLRNVFPLRHGTWLTPRQSRGGADFLSSAATGSREQLGRLRGLRGLPPFSIRPLSAEARDQFFAGDYFVEAQNAARDASFLSTLDSLLAAREQAVGGGTAPARLAYGSPPPLFGEFAVPLVGIASLLGPLEVALAVLLAVVVLYDSLARSKRIGVMRLGGLAPGRIWWQLDGRLVVAGLAAAAVAVWAATWLLEVGPAGLVGSALRAWAATSLLLMVSSGAAWVLARRIRVPEAVKGAKSVGLPLTLDVLVKTGVLAAGVLLSLSSWNDASHDAAVIRRLRAQSVAAPAFARYGLLDQTVGPRLLDYIEEGFSSEQYVQGRWLYPYLVRRGALLIDATDYEPGPRSGTPVLTVSSNFLRAFPLQSLASERIAIPETTRATVVLVPDRDRFRIGAIKAQALAARRADLRDPIGLVPAELEHPRVVVEVYRNQWVQTLDPLVDPRHDHEVADPVIDVLTLGNSLVTDRAAAVGGLDDPMKIPIHDNAGDTYQRLLPELTRLRLAANRSGLETIRQAELSAVAMLRTAILTQAAIALGCVVVGILLARASLALVFARWQRRVLVRRTHGVGLLRSYREWAVVVAATLVAEGLICVLATLGGVDGGASVATALGRVLVCFAAISVVEVVASLVAIRRREQAVVSVALRKEW